MRSSVDTERAFETSGDVDVTSGSESKVGGDQERVRVEVDVSVRLQEAVSVECFKEGLALRVALVSGVGLLVGRGSVGVQLQVKVKA